MKISRAYYCTVLTALAVVFSYAFIPGDQPVVFLAGDSTMSDKPIAVSPERGWGQFLQFYLRAGIRVENFAKNGRSTKSFINEGRWDSLLVKVKPGDFVFIQFGHNDAKKEDSTRYAEAWSTYTTNLTRFVTDVRAKGATPVLLTPVNRRNFDTNGIFTDTHGEYPKAVRTLAASLHVDVLDLHQVSAEKFSALGPEASKRLFMHVPPGLYKGIPDGKTDDTHFNRHGANVIAWFVAKLASQSANPALKELFSELPPQPSESQTEFGAPEWVVAKDCTGDFTTIQEALSAPSTDSTRQHTILIKAGRYEEKIFIEKSNLTLVGEAAGTVSIEFPELRKEWRKSHASDWGAAVVNIQNGVHDVVFKNLSIRNSYGALHQDSDHQFTIRGGGTRIILLNCRIVSEGGDALSLWNAKDGMYYHKDCYFEGHVDFVCPRGWCYIENSHFFGHNLSASIWMDGDYDKEQKFVLKNCSFDGVQNFALGRHHREAAFYLIDCSFSEKMADKPIYFCGPSPIRWPNRTYYYHCHKKGGDFTWFADNLDQADPHLQPAHITPVWTFGGKWDPETFLQKISHQSGN